MADLHGNGSEGKFISLSLHPIRKKIGIRIQQVKNPWILKSANKK